VKLGVALALVAAALVVALQSCGADSDEPRLTYPQLQRQAGAICGRYRRGLAKLGAPSSLAKIAVVARGAYRLGAAERKALARLHPPADGQDAFDRLLDRFAKADELLPQLWRAAEKGDAGTAQALAGQGRALVATGNKDAVALGLLDCRRT
jgi:hypothetical protein